MVVARMVIMHVGYDDVLHLAHIHSGSLQSFGHGPHEFTLAPGAAFGTEAGVDHDGALFVADHPDEIVQRHWKIMRIATDEVFRCVALVMSVADRQDLVDVTHFVPFPGTG